MLTVVLLGSTLLFGQSSFEFEQLSVQHGLSFNQVNSILQDSRGYMWFGTFNGLNKYDGYTFTVYTVIPGDSTSIPVRLANTLYEDSNGDIWANGVGQLARYVRSTDQFVRYPRSTSVTSLVEELTPETDSRMMWFATNGRGLHCYDEVRRTFSYYTHDASDFNTISNDSLTCLHVDQSGTLWIGTANGLNSLDRTRQHLTRYPQGPKRPIWEFREDPDTSSGLLWIGAEDGLYTFDRSRGTFSKYLNDFGEQANNVRTIYFDRRGRLWVGTISGIATFDRATKRFAHYNSEIWANPWADHKTWTFYEDRAGVLYLCGNGTPLRTWNEADRLWKNISQSSDHEYGFVTIFEDRSGTVWFGTWTDGVLKLDPWRKPFTMFTHVPRDPASLSSSRVTGICQDMSGNIWAGTMDGLNKIDRTSGMVTHYVHDDRKKNSISHNSVSCVLEEDDRYLWVGTASGLDKLDRLSNSVRHYLRGEHVTSMHRGKDGTLWVGIGSETLAKHDRLSDTFQQYTPPFQEGFGSWGIEAINQDSEGLIWITVLGRGMISYDPVTGKWGKQHSWNPVSPNWDKELSTFGLHALHLDQRGTLWIGTHAGLARFDKSSETITTYARSELISGILEDDHGYLWLSTTRGILKFEPRSGTFRRYDQSDGVNIGSWSAPTGHRGRTGEMFFGGSNGFVRFHPDSIRDNPHVPPIVITAFSKFNHIVQLDSAISEKKAIELSYKDNMITFEFAALNYTSSEKNQYAYQMVGFDTGWVYCGTERKATYTNLDGGKYTFRVKGSNNDGIWNEAGASIAVIITPPFWATWWFRAFAFVVVLVSVGGTIRYVEKRKLMRRIEQLEQERALERERARISQDMHDEVGSSLSEIAILSELAKQKPEEAGTHVQEISERASEVIDNVSEIVWAMNPKNDTLDNLVAHLRRYAVKYLNLAQINCKFNAPDVIPAHHLTAEVRRNLFLVVKEALHNVVKHSGASEVCVTVSLRETTLALRIEDNGKGFDTAACAQAGNGLVGMDKRMQDIGGTFTLESKPDRGTKVEVGLRS